MCEPRCAGYFVPFATPTDNRFSLIIKVRNPAVDRTWSYLFGDTVVQGGIAYRAIAPSTGQPPPNGVVWTALPTDWYLNKDRRPEWYGNQQDNPTNYRYVGGANPPWTAYDTNSLYLAEVTADGQVLMPSFTRPWLASANNEINRYMSLRPEQGPLSWNPRFVTPDTEFGRHRDVKNLDYSRQQRQHLDRSGFMRRRMAGAQAVFARSWVVESVHCLRTVTRWAAPRGRGSHVSHDGMGPEVNVAIRALRVST